MKRFTAVLALIAVLGIAVPPPAHARDYVRDYWSAWGPVVPNEYKAVGTETKEMWDRNPALGIMYAPVTAVGHTFKIVALSPAFVVTTGLWSMGWAWRSIRGAGGP